MAVEVLERTASVVVLGSFNPRIFQPEWLRSQKIIGQSEASEALADSIEFIHPEVTSLRLTNMRLVVEPERFFVISTQEPWERLKDFVTSCFLLLPHTPCRAVGINYTHAFRASSRDQWDKLGDLLAPKDPWANLLGNEPGERIGGLRSMTMERNRRPDSHAGYSRVTVEALETGAPDTKISTNDHFQLDSNVDGSGQGVVKLIDGDWDASMQRSQDLAASIVDLANGL